LLLLRGFRPARRVGRPAAPISLGRGATVATGPLERPTPATAAAATPAAATAPAAPAFIATATAPRPDEVGASTAARSAKSAVAFVVDRPVPPALKNPRGSGAGLAFRALAARRDDHPAVQALAPAEGPDRLIVVQRRVDHLALER